MRVNASAGSGKTYLLAMRFAQFLLSQRLPRGRVFNLLAITFTNDAALEMKRRILRLFKEAALNPSLTCPHELAALTSCTPQDLSQRAKEILNELFEHYDLWQVRTIDSFLHQLVAAARYELGLSPEHEINPAQDGFYQRAMDDLFLKAEEDAQVFQRLTDLIHHYLYFEEKAAWWPQRWILERLTSFYEQEQVYGKPFVWVSQGPPSKDGIQQAIRGFVQAVEKRGLALQSNAKKALEEACNGRLEHALEKDWFCKGVTGLFKKASIDEAASLEAQWQGLQKDLMAYVEARARQDFRPYLKLLIPWKGLLEAIKHEERVLFFGDINNCVQQIYEGFSLPELFFRLGERIFHILIDEFQDTSELQWQALRPLIEEALSKGGSLFCVGDRKQLLYRWRGAEPRVFDDGPESLKHITQGILERTSGENWRSRKELVDFVADFFSKPRFSSLVDSLTENIPGLYDGLCQVFRDVRQGLPESLRDRRLGGLVHLEFWKGGRTEEVLVRACEWTHAILNEILKRYRPNEVFILMRKRDEISTLTTYLTRQGLPVQSEQQLDLRNSPLVQDVLAMLRMLYRPDNPCVAQVLTSSLIRPLWQACYSSSSDQALSSPWEWLKVQALKKKEAANNENQGLWMAWQNGLPELWAKTFGGPLKTIKSWPVYDIVTKLLQFFDYHTTMPHKEPEVQYLLDLLHQHSGQDIQGVLDWFSTGSEEEFMLKGVQTNQAVRILTIHKSKGLQAPVVILPITLLLANSRKDFYITPLELSEGQGMEALTIPKYAKNISWHLKKIANQELKEAWLDEMRGLYVAMTRAENELYLLVPQKVGNRTNAFWAMCSQQEEGISRFGEEVERKEEVVQPGISEPCVMSYQPLQGSWAWQNSLSHRPGLTIALSSSALELGEAVHDLLAKLLTPLPQRIRGDVAGLFAFLKEKCKGFQPRALTEDEKEALMCICRTLCRPEIEPLFWPPEAAVIWTERELVSAAGELYRMDRVVQWPGCVWVAEFKTGKRRSEDEQQLKAYLSHMSGCYKEMELVGWLLYLQNQEVVCLRP